MQKAPGKSYRKGISLIKLTEMFPDEATAEKWFESILWVNGRVCGHCGSDKTSETSAKTKMPYWCKECRSYFSVRTATTIARSNVPLRKWAFAVYLFVTNLKGISSMKLHREIEVTQKTAWFMLHRLRESWNESGLEQFLEPVEVDETYMGGKRKNMHNSKRKELAHLGRGTSGKTAVVGAKDRDSNKNCCPNRTYRIQKQKRFRTSSSNTQTQMPLSTLTTADFIGDFHSRKKQSITAQKSM